MLDRTKVIQEIDRIAPVLFKESHTIDWFTQSVWQRIIMHQKFIQRIQKAQAEQRLASWQGNLENIVSVQSSDSNYAVCAIDGSQIYPDRHIDGFDCFLINTAGCFLSYGSSSCARFFSQPHVYVPEQFDAVLPMFSVDVVDMVREEREFALMAEQAVLLALESQDNPFVALFDGNLLFWHLEGKGTATRDFFIQRYCAYLDVLYKQKIPVAGYLSLPQFHDIIHLFKVGLGSDVCRDILDSRQANQLMGRLDLLTDAELLLHVLAPCERTALFLSSHPVIAYYPEPLRPCFFYLNTGQEIVRIEVPLWMTQETHLIDMVCAVCIDQCTKGYGYPVALAEAHGQAVVKGADRDFFYQLIYKKAIGQNKHVSFSQKSLKKKIMSI